MNSLGKFTVNYVVDWSNYVVLENNICVFIPFEESVWLHKWCSLSCVVVLCFVLILYPANLVYYHGSALYVLPV